MLGFNGKAHRLQLRSSKLDDYNLIMKDLIEYLVKSIVEKPDKVSIKEAPSQGFTSFEIQADEADLGQIIGKKGKIIKALQTLVQIRGSKENQRYFLKLAESKEKGVTATASG